MVPGQESGKRRRLEHEGDEGLPSTTGRKRLRLGNSDGVTRQGEWRVGVCRGQG